MLVDDRGDVRKTRVRAPRYLVKKGLLKCVRRATSKMGFAATGVPTVVTVPFEIE